MPPFPLGGQWQRPWRRRRHAAAAVL